MAETKESAKKNEAGEASEASERSEGSEAPLLAHLTELRTRLLKCLCALGIGFGLCFIFADEIFRFLLYPYIQAANGATDLQLIYTAPHEFLFTQLKLAFYGSIFIAFPYLAMQIYGFIAPGLYTRERKTLIPFLLAAPCLFILGAGFVFIFVMPLALSFFLNMEQSGVADIVMMNRVSEYLNFVMTLTLAFGLCFQLPVVLVLLGQMEVITATWLRQKRAVAIVLTFAVAAFLTPPDLISQIGLGLPTLLLYELSILAVSMIEKKRGASERELD